MGTDCTWHVRRRREVVNSFPQNLFPIRSRYQSVIKRNTSNGSVLGGSVFVPAKLGFFGDLFSHRKQSHAEQVALIMKLSHTITLQREYPDKVQEMENHAQVARLLESDFWLRRVLCSKIASHPRALQSKCISSLNFVPLTSPAP